MSEITAAGQGEMAPCKQSAAPAVTNKQAAYPRQAHNPNEYSGIGETVSAPSVATSVTVANSDGVSSRKSAVPAAVNKQLTYDKSTTWT